MIDKSLLYSVTVPDIPIIILYLVGIIILAGNLAKKYHPFFRLYFYGLALIHVGMTLYYWDYSQTNPADSIRYYTYTLEKANQNWWTVLNVYRSETFIEFLVYPHANFFGNSYLGTMLVFSFSGLLGYFFLLKTCMDLIVEKKLYPFNRTYLFLLYLPALHFFTCSLGKDSLIFFFINLMIFALLKKKYFLLIISMLMVGLIRAHILVLFLTGYGFAMVFLNRGISVFQKIVFSAIMFAAIALALPIFLDRVGIEDLNLNSVDSTVDRFGGYNQGEGTSVNLKDESILIKIPSYIFRPFFFDAKSAMGIIASVENVFWVYMVFVILKNLVVIRKFNGLKSIFFQLLFSFLTILIAMSSVLNNIGIATRQKTMILPMLFILFVLSIASSQYYKKLNHNYVS